MGSKKYSGKKKPSDSKKNFYKKRLERHKKSMKYDGPGSCVKRGFKNRNGVLEHKQMCLNTSGDEDLKLYIYKCPSCKLWHVTSSEQG